MKYIYTYIFKTNQALCLQSCIFTSVVNEIYKEQHFIVTIHLCDFFSFRLDLSFLTKRNNPTHLISRKSLHLYYLTSKIFDQRTIVHVCITFMFANAEQMKTNHQSCGNVVGSMLFLYYLHNVIVEYYDASYKLFVFLHICNQL